MAKVSESVRVPASPERTWAVASDLARLGEWLTMHEGWRGELPDQLTEGATLTSVVSIKGLRNRITWRVTGYDPPHLLAIAGTGVGGINTVLRLSVGKDGADASKIAVEVEFSGGPVVGPVGMVVGRALKGDVRRSVAALAALV
jgi:uncharacterized protein YndB with AHSA1/START domain